MGILRWSGVVRRGANCRCRWNPPLVKYCFVSPLPEIIEPLYTNAMCADVGEPMAWHGGYDGRTKRITATQRRSVNDDMCRLVTRCTHGAVRRDTDCPRASRNLFLTPARIKPVGRCNQKLKKPKAATFSEVQNISLMAGISSCQSHPSRFFVSTNFFLLCQDFSGF